MKVTDKWFKDTILTPARSAWGDGWEKISLEMRREAVQAQIFKVIAQSDRVDRVSGRTGDLDASALGRHVGALVAAFERWDSRQDP